MEPHQIVNRQLLVTVKLRPIAMVDNAITESMEEVEDSEGLMIMMRLGGKTVRWGSLRGHRSAPVSFYSIVGRRLRTALNAASWIQLEGSRVRGAPIDHLP